MDKLDGYVSNVSVGFFRVQQQTKQMELMINNSTGQLRLQISTEIDDVKAVVEAAMQLGIPSSGETRKGSLPRRN